MQKNLFEKNMFELFGGGGGEEGERGGGLGWWCLQRLRLSHLPSACWNFHYLIFLFYTYFGDLVSMVVVRNNPNEIKVLVD